MFAVRNTTFRDGHHSFVARLMAFTIRFGHANCGGLGGDDPQSLALVCMEPAGRSTVGSGKLAADDLVACEQRRTVDTCGVRDAAMATRCPRPWACSARRLGRLGRWLSRAPYHAPNRARLRPSVGHSKSRAALPCSACAIEFLDPYARARAYGPCGKLVRHCRRATARQIVAGYQSGCALPYAGNFQGICKKI